MLIGIWNKNEGKKTYLYLITGKSPLKMSTQQYGAMNDIELINIVVVKSLSTFLHDFSGVAWCHDGGSQKGNSHTAKKTVTTYKFY